MGKVFEDHPVADQSFVQHGLPVMLISAPEDVMMRSGYRPDRVKLYKAEGCDQAFQVEFARRRVRQALGTQPESAGITVGDRQGHGRILSLYGEPRHVLYNCPAE